MDSKAFKLLADKSDKILLVFPYFINADSCAALGLIHKYFKETLQKEVDIASSRTIPERFNAILKQSGIKRENIITEIEPISYVINVADALKDNVDVKWNRKDTNLQIVLTPENQAIDFGKVSYSRDGGIYDLVITLNISGLTDLADIYTKSEKQFSKYDIVVLNYRLRTINEAKLFLSERNVSTTTEVVLSLLTELEAPIEKDEAELILHGIIGTNGLNGKYKNNVETLKTVTRLAQKFDFDINSIVTQYFTSLSREEIRLYERMFRNLNFDDTKGIAYSFLVANDFAQTGTKPSQLDGMTNLPFNLNESMDLAFLAYQNGENFEIIIQSNNPGVDMRNILKRLGGYGDRYNGIAQLEGNLDDVLKQILQNLTTTKSPQVTQTPQALPSPKVPELPKKEDKPQSPVPVPQLPQKPQTVPQIQQQNTPKPEVKQPEKKQTPQPVPVPSIQNQAKPKQEAPVVKKQEEQKPVQAPVEKKEQPQKPVSPVPTSPVQQPQRQQAVPQVPQQNTQPPKQENKPSAPQVPTKPQPEPPKETPKSPFEKATEYMIDPYAEPVKKAPTFNVQNKPFDKAE
jgi:nanoRNase/pAp phosphatase (c-di-AMP/oligoRNAs hydrolase)